MRMATRRLVSVAVLTLLVWTFGTVIAVVAGWPAQFGGPGDPGNVAGEFVGRGTAFSPPLLPMIALMVFIVLALSRRWWGAVGALGMCFLAVLTFIGSLGEAFAPSTPDVPRAVLVASGVVGGLLSAALLLFGTVELVDRAQASGESLARARRRSIWRHR